MRKFLLFITLLAVSLYAYQPYQPQMMPQGGMDPYAMQGGQQMMPQGGMMPGQQQMMPQQMMPQQPMPQQMAQPMQQAQGQQQMPQEIRNPQEAQPQVMVRRQEEPKYIPLYITHSNNPTGNLNAMMIFLADQLERNVDSKYFSQPTIVTTFSNLDNLKSTSPMGRLISENLAHELQVRKWRVVEIRMAKSIIMNEAGEFSMTRDTSKIKGAHQVRAIVTGTYSFTDDCVIVNAKVINVDTGIMLSSGQISIPLDSLNGMMYDDVNPKLMRIKGE